MLRVFQACCAADAAMPSHSASAAPLGPAITDLIDDTSYGAASARLRALAALLRVRAQDRPAYRHGIDALADAVHEDRRPKPQAAQDDRGERRASRGERPPLAQFVSEEERRTHGTYQLRYDPLNLVSEVTGSVQVRQPLAAVTDIIDPRCWQRYNPIFRSAYRVALGPDGTVEFDDRGRPREAADPNGAGKSWSGVLYEDVLCEWSEATTGRFRNLLNVGFTVAPKQIAASYALHWSLTSQLWLVERPGGIDVDSGAWAAIGDPGGEWTELKLVKRLRFTDATARDADPTGPWDLGQTMNYLAPAFLGTWIDAVFQGVIEYFDPDAPTERDARWQTTEKPGNVAA